MSLNAHVYQIYIAASPELVWAAITESEWTRRYFHTTSFVEPPQRGKAYRTVRADGRPAIDGVIEEMQPPAEGSPGRFVQTWHILVRRGVGARTAEPRGVDGRERWRRASLASGSCTATSIRAL